MRPDKSQKPWLQVWRDWLDSLPLRDEPIEPELSSSAFGASAPAKGEKAPAPHASDQPESRPTAGARPPAA